MTVQTQFIPRNYDFFADLSFATWWDSGQLALLLSHTKAGINVDSNHGKEDF